MKPKITLVTVCYNAEKQLEDTIKSVLEQTYANKEYILIDGNSNDGTLEIITKYANYLAYYVSEPDRGIYDAMNKAVSHAGGEWILFMNVGDSFYDSDVLQKIFAYEIDRKYAVLYGDTAVCFRWGKSIIKSECLTAMKRHMPFCHQSCLVRTEKLKDTPFDLKYKVVADYNFFHRLYEQGAEFLYIQIVVSNYENGGFSARNSARNMIETAAINGSDQSRWFPLYRQYKILYYKLLRMLGPITDFFRKLKYNYN